MLRFTPYEEVKSSTPASHLFDIRQVVCIFTIINTIVAGILSDRILEELPLGGISWLDISPRNVRIRRSTEVFPVFSQTAYGVLSLVFRKCAVG